MNYTKIVAVNEDVTLFIRQVTVHSEERGTNLQL